MLHSIRCKAPEGLVLRNAICLAYSLALKSDGELCLRTHAQRTIAVELLYISHCIRKIM